MQQEIIDLRQMVESIKVEKQDNEFSQQQKDLKIDNHGETKSKSSTNKDIGGIVQFE